MSSELTEEEMRRALFGDVEVSAPSTSVKALEPALEFVAEPHAKPFVKNKAANSFTPRLRVILRVGNDFEGHTQEMTYEADTLSTLLAEQEATKIARKKFRYVEVVSVKPI
ncbi:hypothetical protein [Pseudomonas coleopterorum]|uniref:hypothetical protein n=1 Tax=Pseudomonas coleopterorum TaxID=1605838 RepID=UPI00177CD7C1|nr:hypothetical protein [Pseudomonas coleopterorum]MBD8480404.1 hypothetical protein [Pseudomonas coleopterorum]